MKRGISALAALLLLCLGANLVGQSPTAPSPTGQSPAAPSTALPSTALPSRRPWAEVAAPALVSLGLKPGEPGKLELVFELVTGPEGADRASVEILGPGGRVLETRLLGRAKSSRRSIEYAPSGSGSYGFRVLASRADEASVKAASFGPADFSLPLAAPVLRVLSRGGGQALARWEAVPEAEAYELSSIDPEGLRVLAARLGPAPAGAGLEAPLAGLRVGQRYDFRVLALRGGEAAESAPLRKLVKAEPEREWAFTWFGQSAKAELNRMEMLDADGPVFRLYSSSHKPDGQIDQKGGKFTAFHDGISYYYTVIDPRRENFELKATFTVDYINPTADGQEGFGLLAMDSLGEGGNNSRNHYTNSAGIIATKMEETIGGTKYTSKDTLGSRFVWGLDPEVIAAGDSAIAERGRSAARAYSYARSDLVKAGESYTLVLKKTNTGYHAIYRDAFGEEVERIMYGPEKLLALDPGRVYLGFAAARGCDVTVSGISMTTSDPATDPPALPEPPVLLPLEARVDSPPSYPEAAYPFVFAANADGRLRVQGGGGRLLVADEAVSAGRDFFRELALEPGSNDFRVTFTPDPAYRPGPGMAMGSWDAELGAYVQSLEPVRIDHAVIRHAYPASELYVSPEGSFLGSGSPEDPLDLETALRFSRPGQALLLRGGVYYPERAVLIPRRNSGRPGALKVLRSAEGETAIFDFRYASGGLQLWGDYWRLEGFEVRNTFENVKGVQVGGSHNVLVGLQAYRCGDTGLQISGDSREPFEKWPRDNLVQSCVSHDNCDPAANNADGFAAKLTSGEGNVFRSCIAYNNIDDGWDLFSKIETGPIGAVLIEGCVAFGNGALSDGSVRGDGNGFKLGGDGIAVAHVLRNSLAFRNLAAGVTSNSDPAIVAERNTSYGNAGPNFAFYGKGDGARRFVARGNLSMRGGSADQYAEAPELASADNYFWNGAESRNAAGRRLAPSVFRSLDLSIQPARRPDGSIDLGGLLELNETAPEGVGAVLDRAK